MAACHALMNTIGGANETADAGQRGFDAEVAEAYVTGSRRGGRVAEGGGLLNRYTV